MAALTSAEQAVLDALVAAQAAFVKLPVQHPSESGEWVATIHRLQDLVAARATYRTMSLGRGGKNGESAR